MAKNNLVVGLTFKLKPNVQKINVVAGKTLFFVIGPFCSPILFFLTLASDMVVLYRLCIFNLRTVDETPL